MILALLVTPDSPCINYSYTENLGLYLYQFLFLKNCLFGCTSLSCGTCDLWPSLQHAVSYGLLTVCDLVSRGGIEPKAPALGARS